MIQAQQDTAHLEHVWHFARVAGPENEHSVRKDKYLQWHSAFMCWWWNFFFRLFFRITASHWSDLCRQALWNIHVILPAREICCQFFVGLGNHIWICVSPFSSIWNRCWKELYLVDRTLQGQACIHCLDQGFWLTEIINIWSSESNLFRNRSWTCLRQSYVLCTVYNTINNY